MCCNPLRHRALPTGNAYARFALARPNQMVNGGRRRKFQSALLGNGMLPPPPYSDSDSVAEILSASSVLLR